MSIRFNADEIFEIAEEIERNGAKFYRRAARDADDEEVGKELLDLAAMEDDHLKTFTAMRADLSAHEQMPTVFDPDNEAIAYLRAFADGQVFDAKADPSEKLTGEETAEQVLRIAIGLERDSIAFYVGIRDLVPESLGKDRLNDIIREEMRHVATLNKQLSSLGK